MVMLSSSFYVRLLLAIFHTLQNKMSILYVLAKDISPQSYKKAIRLRLIRTYIVTEGRNKSAVNSQECVFHDIEGTYVHASIHADFIDQFSHLLKEDVIGRVVEFYSPKDKVIAGFPTQLVDFLIEDSKGNRIKCTLWDEHVPAVMPFFNNHSDGHLIVLLQLCRAKTVDSKSKMQVLIEFEQLRNKSMVFRINLKNEHIRNPAKPISVLSVSHNEELEAQYCPSMLDDQDKLSRMIEEDADDLESEESESGDEAISPIVQANLKLKGVANDQDEVDTGAIKRCLLDQFSSSQNLKKCRPLVIKEEKTL
nr:replication protein A 70 kDa DNA-binding subunit A-like [Ipomoea batatas]